MLKDCVIVIHGGNVSVNVDVSIPSKKKEEIIKKSVSSNLIDIYVTMGHLS